MKVIGRHERQVEFFRQPDEVTHRALLDVDAVVHDLGEEVALAEDVLELRCGLLGLLVLAEAQARLNLATDASRGRDETRCVAAEELAVHARLEVIALDRGQRGEAEQVVHALVVLREQGHVGVRTRAADVILALLTGAPAHPRLVAAVGSRRDVRLGADDRLHAVGCGLLPEVVGAEHVAMVGDGDCGHPLGRHRLHELAHPRGTVEHGVLAVHVEVHE